MSFRIAYLHLTVANAKGQMIKVMHILTKIELATDMVKSTITNSKSRSGFRLEYLHLTLTHSKGQDQGHAHFDIEYHRNGDS